MNKITIREVIVAGNNQTGRGDQVIIYVHRNGKEVGVIFPSQYSNHKELDALISKY